MACNIRNGFACFGGTEIWNVCRTLTYVNTLLPQNGFSLSIAKDDNADFCCGCCDDAYVSPAVDEPPWHDPANPQSEGFFGIFPTEIVGLTGNPTTRPVADGYAGGVLGRRGEVPRTIEVTALAFGDSCEAVEWGLAWLNATLERECGADGFAWQNCCPPEESPAESPEDITLSGRTIPCLGLTDGLDAEQYIPETFDGLVWEVNFTLTAERSWIYDTPVVLFNEVVHPGGTAMNCVDYTPQCLDGAAIEVFIDRKENNGNGTLTVLANEAKYLSTDDLDIANARYGAVIDARKGDSILLDPRCLGVWLVGPTGAVRRPAPGVSLSHKAIGLFPVASYGETWRVCVDVPDNGSGPVSVTIRAHPRRRM